MKKTLMTLALLASATPVFAEASYDNLFADGSKWDTSSRYSRPTFTFADGQANLDNSNWSQAVAIRSIADGAMTEKSTLTFTVVMNIPNYDCNFSVVLRGATNGLIFGDPYYDGTHALAAGITTEKPSNNFYSHEAGGTKGLQTLVTDFSTGTDITFTGTVKWVDDQFVATVSAGGSSASVNLGSDFSVQDILLCGDGGNSMHNGTMKSFSLSIVDAQAGQGGSSSNIPEPATAALSLLALAGLAARRRRK